VSAVPAVLHAHRESREECLKIFIKCLPEYQTTNRRIYINPELDLLIVKIAYSMASMYIREKRSLKEHGLGIPKDSSEIPHPNESWDQSRGLWSINSSWNENYDERNTTILVKMFEHHVVLEHNTTVDVRRHLGQEKSPDEFQGMGEWDQSWAMVLEKVAWADDFKSRRRAIK